MPYRPAQTNLDTEQHPKVSQLIRTTLQWKRLFPPRGFAIVIVKMQN